MNRFGESEQPEQEVTTPELQVTDKYSEDAVYIGDGMYITGTGHESTEDI
jgi:hypothetical protein